MFVLTPGRSPEVENSLRYGHFSDLDGCVVEMGSDLTDGDRPLSLCLKGSIKSSLCLKVSRHGIQVSQDYGVSITRVPGLWAVPGLAATERQGEAHDSSLPYVKSKIT